MTSASANHPPTDIMCRRTHLPLRQRFFWLSTPITIDTNSQAVAGAVEQAGFTPHFGLAKKHGLRWEIVVEQSTALHQHWQCDAAMNGYSIYLSMGPYQWFALDLQTGEGTGFVLATDPEEQHDPNVNTYFKAIVENIAAILREEAEEDS
jgi:hypothetical protein